MHQRLPSLLLATLLVAVSAVPAARADAPPLPDFRVHVVASVIPDHYARTSAVWDGKYAYIFGGQDSDGNPSTRILRYDPVLDEIRTLNTTLPEGTSQPAAELVDGATYVFATGADFRGIYRYDHHNDTGRPLTTRLPWKGQGVSTAVNGHQVALLDDAGASAGVQSAMAIFDTTTRNITTLKVTVPATRSPIQTYPAVWIGDRILRFGPCGPDEQHCPDKDYHIQVYDAAGTTETTLTLPDIQGAAVAFHEAAWVWTGHEVLFFGGESWDGDSPDETDLNETGQILRFDPTTDTLQLMPDALDPGRDEASAVWTGDRAYIFGGSHRPGTAQMACYGVPDACSPPWEEAARLEQAANSTFTGVLYAYPRTHACVGVLITFEDAGSGAERWEWTFDDGQTATTPRVRHSFATPGAHTVQLAVYRGNQKLLLGASVKVDPTPCATSSDADGDGISDALDDCPARVDTNQTDHDKDRIGDACDPLPCRNSGAIGQGPAIIDCRPPCNADSPAILPSVTTVGCRHTYPSKLVPVTDVTPTGSANPVPPLSAAWGAVCLLLVAFAARRQR